MKVISKPVLIIITIIDIYIYITQVIKDSKWAEPVTGSSSGRPNRLPVHGVFLFILIFFKIMIEWKTKEMTPYSPKGNQILGKKIVDYW